MSQTTSAAAVEAVSFDAIVIGAGQAGPPLATALAQTGRKTAIIEANTSAAPA